MAIKISGSTIIDDSRNIVSGAAATFTGNVTIGGTLTYEDVTNIDSVGIITAGQGVRITGGGLNVVGITTFTDDVRITGGGLNVVGVVTATSFSGDGSALSGVGTQSANIQAQSLTVAGVSTFNGAVSINAASGFPFTVQAGNSSIPAIRINNQSGTERGSLLADDHLNIEATGNDIILNPNSGGGTSGNIRFKTGSGSVPDIVSFFAIGGVGIAGTLSATGANISGVVTATSFSGDGSALTGVSGGLFVQTDVGIHTLSKVGIGTTNPIAQLDVNVGSSVTAFNIEGSEGQLFSVTNNLSSGSIFAVNDITGIPSIDVNADGTIQLAPFSVGELVGIGTTNPSSKLHLIGDALVVGVVTATSFHGDGSALTGVGTQGLNIDAVGGNFSGVVTATSFSGSGANLTGIGTQSANIQAQSLTVAGISTFNNPVDINSDLNVTGVTTTLGSMVDISNSGSANLTLRNTSGISDDEDIANINIVANDGPAGYSTGAQIKFQANNSWTDSRSQTDIIFRHVNSVSPTSLVDAVKIAGAPTNVSNHIAIGSSSSSNTSNYYVAIKGYERSSQGANGDTVNIGIFNQSQSSAATANIDFRLGQAAISNTAAARLLAGKVGGWTNTASTRDGYFAISVAQNAQILERLRINSAGDVGIGTDNPNADLHIWSTGPDILLTDSNQAADNRNWILTGANTQILRLQAQNDSYAGGGNLFDFYRSGNNINELRGMNAGNYWLTINNSTKKVGIGTDNPQTTLDVVGDVLVSGASTFSGNVSIGGTLTYEDVTNIDSIGIITARTGLKVLAGGINAVGVVTATSFDGSLAASNLTGALPAISGANLTNLTSGNLTGALPAIDGSALTGIGTQTNLGSFDNLVVAGVSTFNNPVGINSDLNVTGITTFNEAVKFFNDLNFKAPAGDLITIRAPFGGHRIVINPDNGTDTKVHLYNDVKATFGFSNDLQIFHTNPDNFIRSTNGKIKLQSDSEEMLVANPNDSVDLYFNNALKLQTRVDGVAIAGIATANGFSAVGVVTATSFSGDGSNLTGLAGFSPDSRCNLFAGFCVGGTAGVGTDKNIAMGFVVGCALNGAKGNIFMGCYVGVAVCGNYNIAFGRRSGTNLTSGHSNILMGNSSGCKLTTGIRNVHIGETNFGESTAADYNIGIGFENANINDVSGDQNVMIGQQNARRITSGFCNTIIGQCNADCLSSASCNVLIGRKVVASGVFTGKDNIFLGQYVASVATSADCNVMLGHRAGSQMTTAADNIALGTCALGTGTVTGDDNIAIGQKAGTNNTSGNNNIYIGCLSGSCQTTGCRNVFLGQSAGQYSVVAHCNIGIGYGALQKVGCTSAGGCQNIALGCSAGAGVTTGCENVFLGLLAGCTITTGSGNIAIGCKAGCSSFTATGDDQLAIGHGTNNWVTGDSSFNVCLAGAGVTMTSGTTSCVIAHRFCGDGSCLTGISAGSASTENVATKGLVVAGVSTFNDDVRITSGGLNVVGVSTFCANSGSLVVRTGTTNSGLIMQYGSAIHGSFRADGTGQQDSGGNKELQMLSNAGCNLRLLTNASGGCSSRIIFQTGFRNGATAGTSMILFGGCNGKSGVSVAGIVTAHGLSLVNGEGPYAGATGILTAVNINSVGGNFTGVVTASSFSGDGSALTGVSGGLFVQTDVGIHTLSKVGIGTTNPIAQLDVNVGSSVTAFNVAGSEGQLFSVTNNLTSGSIFEVNDVSGMPSIDVNADGTIQLAPHGAGELVGIGTTIPTSKLHVVGDTLVTGVTTISNDLHIKSTLPRIYLTDTNHDSDWYIGNSDGTIIFYDETTTNTRFEINPGINIPFIRTPFNTNSIFRGETTLGGHAASPAHSLTVGGISTFSSDVRLTSGLNVSGVSTFSSELKVGTGITFEADGDAYVTGITTLGRGATGDVFLYNPSDTALSATTNDVYGWKAKTYCAGLQVNSTLYLSRSGSNGLSLNYNNATGSYITANSGFLRVGVPYGGDFNLYGNNIYIKDRLQTKNFAHFQKVSGTEYNTHLYGGDSAIKLSTTNEGILVSGGATVTGNLSIGGTVTYEDVTNIDSIGIITARDGIKIPFDDKFLLLGQSNDLSLAHTAGHSYIADTGTGGLYLTGSNVRIQNAAQNEDIAVFNQNDSVDLYFNNDLKFRTKSTGAEVVGILTATSITSPKYLGDADLNIVMGSCAGIAITDTTTSATKNIIIGSCAGSRISTCPNNIFIGSCAGQYAIAPVLTVAIGEAAGRNANATGGTLTAVGAFAGMCNTDGDGNTLIGFAAGRYAKGSGSSYNFYGGYKSGNVANYNCSDSPTGGSCNIALGMNAFSARAGGVNNVILGRFAGYANSTGSNNMAFGNGSLMCNVTGGGNFAGGYLTLTQNLTGGSNVAIGKAAMRCNVSGNHNLGIGFCALALNTAANNNIALGECALRCHDTSGGNNFAAGYSAMRENEGSHNTVIGHTASFCNTTGCFNTSFGYQAGKCNTTGCHNVSIGQCAGIGNGTSSDNISIGQHSHYCGIGAANIAIGRKTRFHDDLVGNSFNIAIGDCAMMGVTDMGTSEGNIAIGRGAGFAHSGGVANIYLGCYVGACNKSGNQNFIAQRKAGYRNETGSDNVMIGDCAGYGYDSGTNQNNNVFIGKYAGYCNRGDHNIGIGFKAGRGIQTGTCNIFFGPSTGQCSGTGSNNIGFGFQVLSLANLSGDNNIALGHYTGRRIATGDGNVFLGAGAGRYVLGGCCNVAIGINASYCLSGGHCNVAIGVHAGSRQTASDNNTSIGHQAGSQNCTGSGNVAVGHSAGYGIRGANNVSIGATAGPANSCINTYDNIFIGRRSGYALTSGCFNVGIGYLAGSSTCAATGSYNIAFGYCSGKAVTSGDNVIAIGCRAGRYNTTGRCNIYLGTHAGGVNTSGGDNILIGNHAGGQFGGSFSGTIAIGCCAGGGYGGGSAGDAIFIGRCAGRYANVSDSQNIAIGNGAGKCITNGLNIIMGSGAMTLATTACANLGLGGQVLQQNLTGDRNVALGAFALAGNTTGSCNVAIGHCSGSQTTGASGSHNFMGGYKSGNALTSGSKNIFLGCDAAACKAVTGDRNVVIGQCAGHFITCGFNNVFIGAEAARTYCNGHDNVSIGASTGPASGNSNIIFGVNTADTMTGDNNIVMGEFASKKCAMSGDHNIVMGSCAACALTSGLCNILIGSLVARTGVLTGCDNVVLGSQAAANMSNASCNIIFGRDTACCLTSGQQNIAIGARAGYHLDSGSHNVFIGENAGAYISPVTSGTGNIAIGNDVDVPSPTGDDQLAIGCNNCRWIVGNSDFNVGIGTTNPNAAVTSGNTQKLSVGILSAYQLYGDGSCLTGISAGSASTTNVQTIGLVVAGVSTFHDDVTLTSANGNNILFDKSANRLHFGDQTCAIFGASDDLQIFHNNADSIIKHNNSTTGNDLLIQSDTKTIFSSVGGAENHAIFNDDGAVQLFHNGDQKFNTTGTGVTISGIATASGFVAVGGGSDNHFRILSTNTDGQFIRDQESTYQWNGSDTNSNIVNGAIGIQIRNNDQTTHKTVALAEFRTYRNSSTANPGIVYIGAVDPGEGSTHSSDFIVALKRGNTTVDERLRVTHDGKVGIASAITSPRAELEVEGSVHATRFFQNPTALDTTTAFPADGGAAVNGGVYGPYTINTGVTLTINSGSTFTVV